VDRPRLAEAGPEQGADGPTGRDGRHGCPALLHPSSLTAARRGRTTGARGADQVGVVVSSATRRFTRASMPAIPRMRSGVTNSSRPIDR